MPAQIPIDSEKLEAFCHRYHIRKGRIGKKGAHYAAFLY